MPAAGPNGPDQTPAPDGVEADGVDTGGVEAGGPAVPDRVRAAIGTPLDTLDAADLEPAVGGGRYTVGLILLYGMACGIAGWAGLWLADLAGGTAPVLPGAGVAVAGLLAGGLRLWPGLFLGVLAVALLAALSEGQDPAALSTLVIPAGSFLGPMIGVALLRATVTAGPPAAGSDPLDRPFAAVLVLVLAAALPALITAAVSIAGLIADRQLDPDDLGQALSIWVRTEMTGVLLIAPPVLALLGPLRRARMRRIAAGGGLPVADGTGLTVEPHDNGTGLVEAMAVTGLAGLLLAVDFTPWVVETPLDLTMLLVGPVVWAAVRLPQVAACLLAAAIAGLAVTATLAGHGPFVRLDGAVMALPLQGFVGLIMALVMLLSAGRREQARLEAGTDGLVARLRADQERAGRTVAQRDRIIATLRRTLEETRVETVAGEDLQAGVLGALAREMTAAATALRAAVDRIARVQPSNRPAPEGLAAAAQAADVLRALASDVTDLAAMEADTLWPVPVPTDLGGLVEDVAARLGDRRPGQVVSFADPAIPASLLADGPRLRQSLTICADAVLRLSDREPVTLRCLMVEGRPHEVVARLEVQTPALFAGRGDNSGAGTGDLPHPMSLDAFLASAGTTPIGSGRAALSLWLARRVAEIMGGGASLRSWPEQGTLISLEFTLARGVADDRGAGTAGLPDLSPVRLLVAEANQAQAELLVRYLTARGAQVETVTDAVQGVDRLRLGERPDGSGGVGIDVLLIDAGMRLAHGRTLLDRLLDSVPEGLRIVALRPPDDPAWRSPGKPGLVAAVLDRPVRRAALYAAVVRAAGLDRRRPAAAEWLATRTTGRRSDAAGAATGSKAAAGAVDAANAGMAPADAVKPPPDPVLAAYYRGARNLLPEMAAAADARDARRVRAIARTVRENGDAVAAADMARLVAGIEAAAAAPDWPAVGAGIEHLHDHLSRTMPDG